ncbi:hypothetical protein ACFX11_037807 [Malus domestica]
MKSLKDWISSRLVSMPLVLPRPLSSSDNFFREESSNEEFDDQGAAHSNTLVTPRIHPAASTSFNSDQENQSGPSLQHVVVENSDHSHDRYGKKKMGPLVRIDDLQVGLVSQNNVLVAKVLYRIHLATLIRAEESDLKRVNLSSDRVIAVAAEQSLDKVFTL